MSSLIVFHQSTPGVPNKLLTHSEDIVSTLQVAGLSYAEVALQTKVVAGEPGDQLLQLVKPQLDVLMASYAMASAEVLSVCDERGEGSKLADSLRQEQRCAVAQVFYCLAGRGQLMLRSAEFIYAVVLEKQGLVVVPANMPFWFDGGENPRFAVARLFESEQVPDFERIEGDLAGRFLRFDLF